MAVTGPRFIYGALLLCYGTILVRAKDELPTLQWLKCPDEPDWLCGDLYFCAAPTTSWQHWVTHGRLWPFPEDDDPNGANGYLYGYHTADDFRCRPGISPVLRLQPGKQYKLTIHNGADMDFPNATMLEQMEDLGPVDNIRNSTGQLFPTHVTNLHLHGVHISGNGDHDNVLKMINPGECYTYRYIIPQDHMGGTNWYHSHFHGKVVFQVFGGCFGMVIVEDDPINLKTQGQALDHRVVDFLTNKAVERNLVVFHGYKLYMGNGNPNGATVELIQGQWHRLRMSVVRPEGYADWLEFLPSKSMLCQIHELAWDGVYSLITPYTAADSISPDTRFKYNIHGAGRVDFAIKCDAIGQFRLQMDEKFVALFKVVQGAPTDATPFNGPSASQWSLIRPPHLADLRDGSIPSEVTTIEAPYDLLVSLEPGNIGFNGKVFNVQVPLTTMSYGAQTIHQIRFINTGPHPIHLHQQHYQVVQPGGCGDTHKEGEFYDTITHSANDDCLVRFRMLDFAGMVIIHCHVLDHADVGLMGWIDVPIEDDSFEASPLFSDDSVPSACCVPRTDAQSGQPVCRGIPSCGHNQGWDSCNQPCTVPMPTCPAIGRYVCTTEGKCVKLNDFAHSTLSGDGSTVSGGSSSVPTYIWVIIAVLAVVTVISVGIAVYFAWKAHPSTNAETIFTAEEFMSKVWHRTNSPASISEREAEIVSSRVLSPADPTFYNMA